MWETSSGKVWKGFGDKETHPVYKGDVKDGLPDGLGFLIYPSGDKYVGEWENGKWNGQGTYTWSDGRKFVGEWKDFSKWNGIFEDKNGNIKYNYVNGKVIKQ